VKTVDSLIAQVKDQEGQIGLLERERDVLLKKLADWQLRERNLVIRVSCAEARADVAEASLMREWQRALTCAVLAAVLVWMLGAAGLFFAVRYSVPGIVR
jgi:membrane-bound ClpP family serine protease